MREPFVLWIGQSGTTAALPHPMKIQIASINGGRVTVTEITPSCSEGAAASLAIASMALCGLPLAPNTEHQFEVKTPHGISTFKDRSVALEFAHRAACQ